MGTPTGPPRRDWPDPGRPETRVTGDAYYSPVDADDYGDGAGYAPQRRPLAIIGSLAALIGLGVIVVAVLLGIFGQLSDVLPWVLGGAALVVLGFVVTTISAMLRR